MVRIVALLLFILKNYGLLRLIGLTEDIFKELTMLIFLILSAYEIINDPTQKDGF